MTHQLHPKVYENINEVPPLISSTTFMSNAVRANEKYKLHNQQQVEQACAAAPKRQRAPENRPNEVIWGVNEQVRNRTIDKRYQARPNFNDKKGRETSHNCEKCGRRGHTTFDCLLKNLRCVFCKANGHNVKACKKRLAQAKGKYCENCKLADSHNTNECYSRRGENRVRTLTLSQPEMQAQESEEEEYAAWGTHQNQTPYEHDFNPDEYSDSGDQ